MPKDRQKTRANKKFYKEDKEINSVIRNGNIYDPTEYLAIKHICDSNTPKR